MASRVKERNHPNHFKLRHDAFGSYIEQNGLRTYSITRAIPPGTSSTYGGVKIPAGSLVRTNNATGGTNLWIAGANTLNDVGGGATTFGAGLGGVEGAKAYKAYFSQRGTDAPYMGREIVNDFEGMVVSFSRSGVGVYGFQFPNLLDTGELFIESIQVVESEAAAYARIIIVDTSNLRCDVFSPAGTPVDVEGEIHLSMVLYPDEVEEDEAGRRAEQEEAVP